MDKKIFVVCPGCQGGFPEHMEKKGCPKCGGSGKVLWGYMEEPDPPSEPVEEKKSFYEKKSAVDKKAA